MCIGTNRARWAPPAGAGGCLVGDGVVLGSVSGIAAAGGGVVVGEG